MGRLCKICSLRYHILPPGPSPSVIVFCVKDTSQGLEPTSQLGKY